MNHPTSTTAQPLRIETRAARAALPVALTIRSDASELEALWQMSKQQRIAAMWTGQLSLSQLTEWTGRRPNEVPLLGSEFAWLVIHTPEWDEPCEQRNNVVALPKRGEHRAAA